MGGMHRGHISLLAARLKRHIAIGQLSSGIVALATVGLFAGCGSAQTTVTVASPTAGDVTPTTSSSTPTATAPQASAAYPVVPWTDGGYNLDLQLVSITKNPRGFEGAQNQPPGKDWLMVRVNIINETPERSPSTPELGLLCREPGGPAWNPGDANVPSAMEHGYEQAPGSNQLVMSSSVGLGYQQPVTYGAEWEVPERTDTSKVTCRVDEQGNPVVRLN